MANSARKHTALSALGQTLSVYVWHAAKQRPPPCFWAAAYAVHARSDFVSVCLACSEAASAHSTGVSFTAYRRKHVHAHNLCKNPDCSMLMAGSICSHTCKMQPHTWAHLCLPTRVASVVVEFCTVMCNHTRIRLA